MSAIRMLFSWLTEKGILAMNPAREVKTEKFSRTEGKTPAFDTEQVQKGPGLDEIRALGSDAGGSVPVIAMSAFFSETDRKRMHHADFRACLPKPFTPDKLLETILGIL
jgi:DNA-binding NarL/FixJ family response regulator